MLFGCHAMLPKWQLVCTTADGTGAESPRPSHSCWLLSVYSDDRPTWLKQGTKSQLYTTKNTTKVTKLIHLYIIIHNQCKAKCARLSYLDEAEGLPAVISHRQSANAGQLTANKDEWILHAAVAPLCC